jgi:hypothetical protein
MPRAPRTFIALMAVAGALAVPAVARADHGRPFVDPGVQTYLEIAQDHWGVPAPTCTAPSGEKIPVHVVLSDNPDPDVVATAEQPGCRMWLDRDWWPSRPSRVACTIIAHEWGHLLGRGHSHDRNDLMFPEPLSGAPGCWMFTPRITLGSAVVRSSDGHHARRRGRRARRSALARRSARARPTHRHRRGAQPATL